MSVKATAKHLSKAEIDVKGGTEERLRGSADKLKPPPHLTSAQKKIFKFIVAEMKASGVLGNLDVYVLAEFAVSWDRMRAIDKMINEDFTQIANQALISARRECVKSFCRCCNELGLSPQSRAKFGNLNLQAEKENPLMKLLAEDEQ